MARKTTSRRADPAKAKAKATTTRSTPTPVSPATPELDPRERAARALEAKAEAGDVAAIKAMADGVADRLREPPVTGPVRGDQLPPHVAAAMEQAGIEAMNLPPPPDLTDVGARITCPLCNRIFVAVVNRKTGQVTGCRPQSGP